MDNQTKQWFVMRDLTRPNGEVPYMQDLLFVYDTRSVIDPLVEEVPTFQYRFLRHTYRVPMTVREKDMEQFIRAVESSASPQYYLPPEEVTPDMRNRKIRMIGGQLDGYEGSLITVRGSKVKRLLVELPSLLAATVEVEPEFIQLL